MKNMQKKNTILNGIAVVCIASAVMTACSARNDSATSSESTASPSSITEEETVTEDSIEKEIDLLNVEKPESFGTIKLSEYKDLVVTVPVESEVSDDEIEAQIVTDMASFKEDADTVQNGDTITIDFVGKKDGKVFDGGSAESYSVVVGSNTLVSGFEEGMVGMKSGESKDIDVTFPEDYSNTDLAGQTVTFSVVVNNIKRTPELTDDYAHQIDETCNTVDEYKAKIRESLEKQNDFSYLQNKGYQVMDDLRQTSEISVTDEAIDWAKNVLIKDYYVPTFANYYGATFASILAGENTSLASFKEQINASAKQMAEDVLITDTIAEKEGIKITNDTITDYAAMLDLTADNLLSSFGEEYVDINVKQYEVFKKLNDAVVFTYVEETSAETAE